MTVDAFDSAKILGSLSIDKYHIRHPLNSAQRGGEGGSMSDKQRVTSALLNERDVERTIARIAHQIIEKNALDSESSDTPVLLGIPSGSATGRADRGSD